MVAEPAQDIAPLAEQVRREMRLSFDRAAGGVALLQQPEPEVGLTPRDELYRRGTMRLYRYRPLTNEVYRVPVILVMSLISKPYILDLVPGQSFVEYLLQQGFDTYMVDWGTPRPEDHKLRLEDYVLEMLPRCVEEVQRTADERDVSMLGYCMGGLFGLMYGALPEAPLKNLVCVATPVDFSGMTLLRHWADPRWFKLDEIVDGVGNIPADLVLASLEFLRPMERTMSYLRLWDNLWDETYVHDWRVRYKWINDQVPFPGECYRQIVKKLLWENKLMEGGLRLGDRPINPRNVTCPVMHATAEFDHIAPYAATRPLTSLVGSDDTRDLHLRGGHVSLIAGANAILRLWPTTSAWLSERSV